MKRLMQSSRLAVVVAIGVIGCGESSSAEPEMDGDAMVRPDGVCDEGCAEYPEDPCRARPTGPNMFVDEITSAECLPRQLPIECDGVAQIALVEATAQESCDCERAGRETPDPLIRDAVLRALETRNRSDLSCVCEIPQLKQPELDVCQRSADTAAAGDGFCYIDPAQDVGEPGLVSSCPADSRRSIRFVGEGVATAEGLLLVVAF